MNELAVGTVGTGRHPIVSAIANSRRRHVLALLLDRESAVPVEELATGLAKSEGDDQPAAPGREGVRSARGDLVHVHLPILDDAGLVDFRRDGGTVSTTDHPVLEDPTFRGILATDADGWDDVLAVLADRRRRFALSILSENSPLALAALARDVAAFESGETDPGVIEEVYVALHHVHVPKLSEAGLVAVDPASGTVSYEGHPALEDSWLDCRSDEGLFGTLSTDVRTERARPAAGTGPEHGWPAGTGTDERLQDSTEPDRDESETDFPTEVSP